MAQKESASRLMQVLKSLSSAKRFNRCLKQMKCMQVEAGHCTFYLNVEQEHTNVFGTLHGGLTATIADVISFVALESHPKFLTSSKLPFKLGVTSSLQISYLNPVRNGEDAFFKAELVNIQDHLAMVEISITNSDSTKMYARGSVNISLLS